MNRTAPKEESVTQTQLLKERGWTRSLIREFLGEPDQKKANWRFRHGPSVRLYRLVRVEEAEADEGFQRTVAQWQGRREAWRVATRRRWERTFGPARTCPIHLPKLTREELIEKALRYGEERDLEDGDELDSDVDEDMALNVEEEVGPRSDDPDLPFWCVEYLQAVAEYDRELGRKGGARRILRERILRAIAGAYPWLAEECLDQLEC